MVPMVLYTSYAKYCITCRLHLQGNILFLRRVHRLLVTANVVPSSPILVSLMMEALHSSEMSVVIRATRRNIPEDGILQVYISHSLSPVNNINVQLFERIYFQTQWHFFLRDERVPRESTAHVHVM
jgi:hypothetical protein